MPSKKTKAQKKKKHQDREFNYPTQCEIAQWLWNFLPEHGSDIWTTATEVKAALRDHPIAQWTLATDNVQKRLSSTATWFTTNADNCAFQRGPEEPLGNTADEAPYGNYPAVCYQRAREVPVAPQRPLAAPPLRLDNRRGKEILNHWRRTRLTENLLATRERIRHTLQTTIQDFFCDNAIQLFLFGSSRASTATTGSDLDFCLVFDDAWNQKTIFSKNIAKWLLGRVCGCLKPVVDSVCFIHSARVPIVQGTVSLDDYTVGFDISVVTVAIKTSSLFLHYMRQGCESGSIRHDTIPPMESDSSDAATTQQGWTNWCNSALNSILGTSTSSDTSPSGTANTNGLTDQEKQLALRSFLCWIVHWSKQTMLNNGRPDLFNSITLHLMGLHYLTRVGEVRFVPIDNPAVAELEKLPNPVYSENIFSNDDNVDEKAICEYLGRLWTGFLWFYNMYFINPPADLVETEVVQIRCGHTQMPRREELGLEVPLVVENPYEIHRNMSRGIVEHNWARVQSIFANAH